MKLTYGKIYESFPALRRLMAQPLDIKASLRLAAFSKEIQGNMEVFAEKHMELLEKYGTRKGDTEEFDIPPESLSDFQAEYNELSSVEIDVFPPEISESDLEGVKITPADSMALLWMMPELDKGSSRST